MGLANHIQEFTDIGAPELVLTPHVKQPLAANFECLDSSCKATLSLLEVILG